MKFILISLTILATVFISLACKHPKYTPEKFSVKQILWGNGGGFVGKETTHTLCDNGQIFYFDMMGNVTVAGKTKGKKAKALFKKMESLGFSKMEFKHPGNTYSFLEFQEADKATRVVWGDKNSPVDKRITDLFAELNGLLKK